MEINLPPLRERKDDIVPMAHFLLKQLGEKYNQSEVILTKTWPNIWNVTLERKY
jgi:transcriptional regulator with AAA-type ATPase domain